MATKIKTEKYSIEEFNAWTKFIGFGSRFDYNDFENRELVKRIEEAKFAQDNPVVPTPSDQLESQQTNSRSLFSGIKSMLNFF
jgi:hypothetical protein